MEKQYTLNGQLFQAGNVVRVMRQTEDNDPNGMGEGVEWDNCWIASDGDRLSMDGVLGCTLVIEDIQDEGVSFVGETCGYLYPLASLDFIATSKVVSQAA